MKSLLFKLAVVVVLGASVICSTSAAPGDKEKAKTKLKAVLGDKEGSKITEEERRFLKEVEAKFKINTKESDKVDIKKLLEKKTKGLKLPFPAVIAVEIVNDTTADGKGKRTIDANLGYGYKTDNGYFYQKFGSPEDKGKFMVYPYSQEDIPPLRSNSYSANSHYSTVYTNKHNGEKTYVDIQPSKAFQLIPVDSNDHQGGHDSYNPSNVVSYLRTKYENVQSVETPPPPRYSASDDYYQQHSQTESPKTYYSAYNGHGQFSEFTGSFPSVMSNYYVNPSQLHGHGQTSQHDYPGIQQDAVAGPKQVIPVFILRIPSSQISQEHASAFNQLNLQALVTQYLAQLQPYVISKPAPSAHPQTYYHQRPVYSTPSTVSHYSSPQSHYSFSADHSSYSQPQQYEEQNVKYIPQYQTKTRLPSSHTTFSQVYHSLNSKEQQYPSHYSQGEADSQEIPISENYPDHHHTRVVFQPHYAKQQEQEQEQAYQDEHAESYSTEAPESAAHGYRTVSHHPQISIVHNGHAVQDDGQYESYGTQQEEPTKEDEGDHQQYEHVQEHQQYQADEEDDKTPYNYHAHPFPANKRQTKSSSVGANKRQVPTPRSKRPLRSGTETSVITKL